MPFTWKLDQSVYDLTIKKGKLQTVYNADEVQQRILVTLWHYWEEYFLNVPSGVPWYELILGSKDKKMVEALLRYYILQVPGVISIIRFQVQTPLPAMRDFAIYADVEVVGGQAISIFETVSKATGNFLLSDNGAIISTQDGLFIGLPS